MNRIEAQTILTDCTDFSLDEQLRQCILVTRQKWRDKPLQFEAELAPCTYHGSEALVKEIWLNLLDNAAKFSPENGTISVTLHCELGRPVVAVTDQAAVWTPRPAAISLSSSIRGHQPQDARQRLGPCHGTKNSRPARRRCHCGQPPRQRQLLYGCFEMNIA